MSCMLKLSGLTIRRGGQPLLSNLDAQINKGQITVVLGPNGAGKSSLLLAMAGLIPCDGTIAIDGTPISNYRRTELTRQIAWQGELPPTEFGLSVHQRLQLACQEAEASAIDRVSREMDIAHLLERPLGQLSSGERQRTELAALALREAPVWLLDEPTAHLDLKHQIRCIRMLKAQRDKGRTIITVLHDIQQAMAVADQLILIDGKGGALFGEAKALFETARLSRLFDAALIQHGALLVPDYGVENESER